MIDDRIYAKKRIYKITPGYLKSLELFDVKPILTLDEFIELHEKIFGQTVTRSQAQGRLWRLRKHEYIRNAGLRVYKKITDHKNEKTDFYYQLDN